jgi:uncharacterized alpha-E superfamily protein
MERAYTTLDIFFDYHDITLDQDKDSYRKFLSKLGIEDKYGNYENFISGFLYSRADIFTISSTFRLAYDNALVIRNIIGSESLAYMELALNLFDATCNSKNIRLALMPVMDYLFAFWGCIDDKLTTDEAGVIIKCGKFVERLDIYLRFSCEQELIDREREKLNHIISHLPSDFCKAAHLTEWVKFSIDKNSEIVA